MRIFAAIVLLLWCASPSARAAEPDTGPGATTVLKWKDGKKACFMMAFDDGAPSQLKNVIPELEKRKLVGNFYLVTGNKLYAGLKPKWEAAAKSPYVAVANHTFTHGGATTPEKLDEELSKCNEVLYKLFPDKKQPYLLGFGKPGGVPWTVSKEEVEAALKKHNLCDRPPFWGPPMHYKDAKALVGAVDTALAKGEMGHADMHGVGGDWLTTPTDWFIALCDKLEKDRDKVWVTDVVSWHQYVTERKTAVVKVAQADKSRIRLDLTCDADPKLYTLPLTLSTKVPAEWKSCVVAQESKKETVTVRDGAVQYDAVPGGGEITIAAEKP